MSNSTFASRRYFLFWSHPLRLVIQQSSALNQMLKWAQSCNNGLRCVCDMLCLPIECHLSDLEIPAFIAIIHVIAAQDLKPREGITAFPLAASFQLAVFSLTSLFCFLPGFIQRSLCWANFLSVTLRSSAWLEERLTPSVLQVCPSLHGS